MKHTLRLFTKLPEIFNEFPVHIDVIDENQIHHAKTVMRLKANDGIIIVDENQECAYEGIIIEIDRKSIKVSLTQPIPKSSSFFPHVILGASVVKEQRWDILLQKSAELGVRKIHPLQSEHTVVKTPQGDKKQQRWQSILQGAAMQSDGLFIPKIKEPESLTQFFQSTENIQLKILLLERGENRLSLKGLLNQHQPFPEKIVVAIGPEGGWSDREIDMFLENGFQSASLGERVLRSETAAIAFMTALAYELESSSCELLS